MYLLGYDIGSSSIKAAIVHAESGRSIAAVHSPEEELSIMAPKPGWAEQDPETWWTHVCLATKQLLKQTGIAPSEIKGIGISYQMHGLVVIDKDQKVLRPSIIWCDSRAVEIGNKAFEAIGQEACLSQLLNSPGNFTASKLKWVKDNEPAIYERIDKFMLPGDYIGMKLTGEVVTTPSGLSEGIFYDFIKNDVSETILNHYEFDRALIPTITPTLSNQGKLTEKAALETGLEKGIPVSYRAGDQPNNALCLNVLQPGEIAATGGTSGVVYGLVDKAAYDLQSRVNGFAHVNHQAHAPRIGILLCINGAGIQYKWVRENMTKTGMSYKEMDQLADAIPVGSEGLRILPFGNGAERMLTNQNPGAHIGNLQFNVHTQAHFYRAALEGIAFSFVHGINIMDDMGLDVSVMRVGSDNLFRSKIFAQTIANLCNCSIDMVETTGAIGAAKAAGVAVGIYGSVEEAMKNTTVLKTYTPTTNNGAYHTAFEAWSKHLKELT